jgi:MinD-like ATPase involved in chromosome partitioning or flagellar assembly
MTIDLTALESLQQQEETHRFGITLEPTGEALLTLRAPGLDTEKVWECRDAQAAERVALKQARVLAQQNDTTLTVVVVTADGQETTFLATASSVTELPAATPADPEPDLEATTMQVAPIPAAPAAPEVVEVPVVVEVVEAEVIHQDPTESDTEPVDPAEPADDAEDARLLGTRPTAPRRGAGSRLRNAAAAMDEPAEPTEPAGGPVRKQRATKPREVEARPMNLPKAPPMEQAADDLERPERRFRLRRPQTPTGSRPKAPQPAPRPVTPRPARPQPSVAAVHRTHNGRVTFLPEHDPAAQPATRGWRGAVNLLGAHLRPDARELTYRDDEAAAATAWTGPRTIAVVNGKGGAGKTPTTAMLSAVFAHYGSSTLAWDNNPLRGTLGWRTEQAHHEATILDLLAQTERLNGPAARAADLTAFLHHQRADRFDVLRSQPQRLASDLRLVGRDVDAVHQIVSKFFRLIVMDSGNDESDPMWRAMIEHTDQLVVVTTTQAGTAEAGALLLDSLTDRGGHGAELARNAVAVVTQADRSAKSTDVRAIEAGYRDLVAPERVVTIPHDPGMVEGALRLRELRVNTQRAWLAAAATVARAMPVDVEESDLPH